MTLGMRIEMLRSRRMLTQAELGKRCGWPDSRVGAYERGEVRRPRKENLEKLAKAFEMSLEEFMEGVDNL